MRTIEEFRRLGDPNSATALYVWWANQVGHFFLGLTACVAFGPWWAVAPYLVKELVFDLRAGRSIAVVLADLARGERSKTWRDSLTDIGFWSAGALGASQGVAADSPLWWASLGVLTAGLIIGAERGWERG